jgi:hypothetical protein
MIIIIISIIFMATSIFVIPINDLGREGATPLFLVRY